MKGKTSVGADKLFEMYDVIPHYDNWDQFHYAYVNELDWLPRFVYIGKLLHVLVQPTEGK